MGMRNAVIGVLAWVAWGCGSGSPAGDLGDAAGDAGDDSGIREVIEDPGTPDPATDPAADGNGAAGVPGDDGEAAPDLPESDPGIPDAGDLPWTPPFDPAACGAEPYAWLPPGRVGTVVSFDPTEDYSEMSAELVRALAEAQDGGRPHPELKYGSRNFNLRYTTQDRGRPVEATAVVGVPTGLADGEEPPLAIFLHGTTGFMDDCAPSRGPDGALAVTLLSALGYLAVAPDYIGMNGFGERSPEGTIQAYLVGEAVALGSLDAARAARKAVAGIEDAPRPDASRTVVWGGSQGGHAAFFVERYAPHYAPEIRLAAVVALVPPTDLLGLAEYAATHWGDTATTMTAVLAAMRSWYGSPPDLAGVLTDEGPAFLATSLPRWMASGCGSPPVFRDSDTLEETYTADFLEQAAAGRWDDLPPWGCYLRVNSVHGTPVPRASDVPFLATFGERDTLVITPVQLRDMERLCGQGYRIEVLECAGAGHTSGLVPMVAYAHAWTQARIRGDPWDSARVCHLDGPVDCASLAP